MEERKRKHAHTHTKGIKWIKSVESNYYAGVFSVSNVSGLPVNHICYPLEIMMR